MNSTEHVVPFHKADVGEEEAQAIAEVIKSGWLTMGPKTFQFEEEFASYIGARHAIAVSSCTAGLHLALDAIGLQPGDEVILPTNTFTATAEVVTYFGARPVLADIEQTTLNLDPEDIEQRINSRTRAIIPVHFGGQPCMLDRIHDIAHRYNLRVIEDAAHSLPATYRRKSIGTLSELTVFSFYATKTLTTGEGGMVTTSDDELAARIRLMRLHGIGRDAWKRYASNGSWFYEVLNAGFKYNMTDIQAAMGIVQLRKVDQMADARRSIAQRYDDAFEKIEQLEIPTVNHDCQSAWHLYPLRIRTELISLRRDLLIDSLKKQGVGTSVHFIPLHLHPYYQQTFSYKMGDFPIAEAEYKRYLSLPIHSKMDERDVRYVIDMVSEAIHSSSRSSVGSTVG